MITGKEQFMREMNDSYLPFVCQRLNELESTSDDDTFLELDQNTFYHVFGFYQFSHTYHRTNGGQKLIQKSYQHFIEQHGWKHSLPQITAKYFKVLAQNVGKMKWKTIRDIVENDDYQKKYFRKTKRRWRRFLWRQHRYFKKIAKQLEQEGQLKLKK
ncbi:MAG: hypothetical protein OXC67_04895 [Flavobacteriaceae bacterium]|nr:hypothetical protein [Flavobacteriaceae bacterium]